MASKKTLFATDNPLLRRTNQSVQEAASPPPAQGDEGSEKHANRQSTVFLADEQIAWLDDRYLEIRRSGGSATIKKAAIIRALIAAAMECTVNLKGTKTEDELVDRIKQGMGIH
jgi:hypothetical protein